MFCWVFLLNQCCMSYMYLFLLKVLGVRNPDDWCPPPQPILKTKTVWGPCAASHLLQKLKLDSCLSGNMFVCWFSKSSPTPWAFWTNLFLLFFPCAKKCNDNLWSCFYIQYLISKELFFFCRYKPTRCCQSRQPQQLNQRKNLPRIQILTFKGCT